MKTHWKLILLLTMLVVAVWSWGGSASTAPDQKLVGHLDKMCKIAEKGIAAPKRGVKKLFGYYGRHTPEMFKQLGELLVTIEGIKDDEAHDERARLAGRRLREAIASCERTYERFGLAIEADPEASALVERGATRFGRTIELILSGGTAIHPGALVPRFDEMLLDMATR